MSLRDKLRRVDFVGAILLSVTIFTALFTLDSGGQNYAWSHPIVVSSGCVAIVAAVSFSLFEIYFAKEPIFPVELLARRVVATSYGILLLQNFSQTALMFVIPLYFQVTKNATTGQAGAYLVPSIFGNLIGGLLTGMWIKR
jgi:hypothetical protein